MPWKLSQNTVAGSGYLTGPDRCILYLYRANLAALMLKLESSANFSLSAGRSVTSRCQDSVPETLQTF